MLARIAGISDACIKDYLFASVQIGGDDTKRYLKFFEGINANNLAQKFDDFVAFDHTALLKEIWIN
jgi:hypothetical protein|tara:strand:+ start:9343 stop:9540 length:198 start_codon:yes stop_codon:yes gene_type:complete